MSGNSKQKSIFYENLKNKIRPKILIPTNIQKFRLEKMARSQVTALNVGSKMFLKQGRNISEKLKKFKIVQFLFGKNRRE